MAKGESPLHQFEIQSIIDLQLFGQDISFTNSSLWMTITTIFIIGFFSIPFLKSKKTNSVQDLYPTRLQVAAELGYNFISSLINDTVGKEGKKYFPLVFSLFMFILFGNLFGMIPYSFTFTSHIIVTLALAMGVFIFVTILGFVKHGIKFFGFFVIPGLPFYMLPLLIPIEVISYLSRPVSLSVRLFANMLAGHTLLKVFAGFVSALGFFGILPLVFIIALTGLEILIAFLQAYVFAILTCLYINDALHLH
jgi:F-type H+-transporting ATPase subunit a